MTRRFFFAALPLFAQQSPTEPPVEFICPMDRDVRAPQPGRCPRCGMTLVAGIADFAEYPVTLRTSPAVRRAGQPVRLHFTIGDPKTKKPVTEFQVVHEKLYHVFIVSQDLSFFRHDHPRLLRRGEFVLETAFPKPGMYRILSDFYPSHGTPQLTSNTVIVPGAPISPGAALQPDLTAKQSTNLGVSLSLEPAHPIAGMKTLMFLRLSPADGLQQYLGAWGHMLAASEDLIDMIHNHPFLADGGPAVQFNLIFPRPVVYRVWVQFQRQGVVNTAHFDIPVTELK